MSSERFKNYLKHIQRECYSKWVEDLELINGQITLKLYNIRFNKSDKQPKHKLIYKETFDKKWVSSDLYFNGISGYSVIYEPKRMSYYGICSPLNKMYVYHGDKPDMSSKRFLWSVELIKQFDNRFKYLYLDNLGVDIIKYLKTWLQYPILEPLAKCGLQYLYSDKRVLNLSDENKKSFISWFKANKQDVLKQHPSYNIIHQCMRFNLTLKEYPDYRSTRDVQIALKEFKFDFNLCNDIKKHLANQYVSVDIYKDYLIMAKNLKMNLSDRGVLFPKSVHKAHNELVELSNKERTNILNSKLKKVYSILKGMEITDDNFKIFIPKNLDDFKFIGESLHNCVARCNYDEKMANGQLIIVAVYKDNKPLECCELKKCKKTLTIQQLRGDHNMDSKYHDEAKSLVNKFIKIYNRKDFIKNEKFRVLEQQA